MFASLFAKTQAQPQRNYSRLVIISDFHYPCKNLVPPKERLMRMAAKERVLQEMNDWRDLDLAVFTGDMVQRNGDAAEYRLVRLVVNGLKKRKAFIAGNHELLYTGHHGELRPGSCTERIIHFARYTQTFGPLYYAGEQGGYLLVFLSPDTVTGGAAVELSHQQLAWLPIASSRRSSSAMPRWNRRPYRAVLASACRRRAILSSRQLISVLSWPAITRSACGYPAIPIRCQAMPPSWMTPITMKAASSTSITAIGMKTRFTLTPSTFTKTTYSSGPMTIARGPGSRPSTAPWSCLTA